MINSRHVLVVSALLLTTACSQGDVVPKVKQTQSQESVQKKVDSFVQSRIKILEKAKGLENTLKEAEEKRRKVIEDFGG